MPIVLPHPARSPRRLAVLVVLVAGLGACAPADGIDPEGATFAGVGPEEAVTLLGTEPFWNLAIAPGGSAVYATPDRPDGTRLAVTRFAGNNGLGFSGTLGDVPLTATLTPGACSDGMSDRTYPFTATVLIGETTLRGCGFTSAQGFSGDPAP